MQHLGITGAAATEVPERNTLPTTLDLFPQPTKLTERHRVKTTRGSHYTFIHLNRPYESSDVSPDPQN